MDGSDMSDWFVDGFMHYIEDLRGRRWGNEDLGRYLGWWEASRSQLGSVLGLGKKRLPQKRCEEPEDYEHTSLNTHLIAFAFIKNGTSAK